ncbi:MAG: DNA translocase FtsK [Oscillospiraceae bacterium]|nr:DNA translocase FtsK [Oscillospiraceae bacterium]
MATTQKKPNAASPRKTGSARSSSASSRSSSASGRKKAPEPKPIRREVGALVCLLLAVFSALGYFRVEAIFIDFFCGSVKGLIGYGYWLLPPALLTAAVILGFHRGRPVRLRVWCALLLPVVLGCFLHLLLAKGEYPWSLDLVTQLWKEGKTLTSGGVISGLLSQALIAVFSKIGAGVIFVLALVGLTMGVSRLTPVEIIDWIKGYPHPEYEEEEEPVREPRRRPEPAPSKPASPELPPRRRRAVIDIPVDGEPEPPEEEPKESFFDRKAKVPAPDQLLAGKPKEPVTPPVREPVVPPVAPPDPFPVPMDPTPAEEPLPEPPEITREPAVPKLKKGDAEEAAAQISQEVAENMAQTAPAYQYPPVSLLKAGSDSDATGVANELRANQTRLTDTIHSFGIDANIINVTRGPSVTRYELELDQGVRLNKLTNLADDIALALGASGVRIAPIPDKISMVGIEVPNKLVTPVQIHDVIDSDQFQTHDSKVAFAVGKDIGGNCVVGNIAKLPHLLIAGTTGSGKSVCTNSLIISLLYKASPEEVRLIMVDPKMVELGIYNGIPHLLIPVVTDPKKAAGALQWAVVEMMKRYRAFSEVGVRDLASYNVHAAKTENMEKMPQIVVVIDELADLMLVAAKEVEESICRVAQMGRAAGMHLIVATQRPSADVITGLMKANIPSRIAFAVASSLESRIILDNTGAEKLVGRGDMLYLPLGAGKPTRVQGCLITDEEVASVVEFVKRSGTAQYDETVLHEIEKSVAEKEKGAKGVGGSAPEAVDDAYDELLPSAIEVVVETGMASVSMLQRRLKLGYSRAARLVDQMEEKGVVGPFEGSKPRQVLITKEQWQEMQYKQGMVDLAPDAPPISEPVPEELDYQGDAVPQPRDMPPFDMGEEDF